MLRTGEEIISEVKEIVEPETEKPIGFQLHKPFRLDIIDSKQGQGYQLEWFPWAPLSKDKDFYLPPSHIVTTYDPIDALATQYVSAIDDARYDENFKKHEERFNLSYEENDLENMFEEAEKIMNEDEETKPV